MKPSRLVTSGSVRRPTVRGLRKITKAALASGAAAAAIAATVGVPAPANASEGSYLQAVNDAGTFHAADIRQTSKMVEQPRDERPLPVSCARVNNHPGRLADDSEKIIFKKNFYWHLLGARRLAARR